MKEMIAAWRNGWGYEFPFYIVQLSSWLKPVNDPNDWKKVGSFAERHNWLVLQKYRIPVLP